MKTATIKTDRAEILLVELPENSFLTADEFHYGYKPINGDLFTIIFDLKWKFIGRIPDLKEEMVEPLVDNWESVSNDGTKVYENYKSGVPKFTTALESLLSLLETKIYWGNPYQDDWNELCTWGHGGFAKDGKSEFELYTEARTDQSLNFSFM